jgi:hypothetical protein
MHSSPYVMPSGAEELASGPWPPSTYESRSMSDPNLPLLLEAAEKLGPLLRDVVFVGGVTLGLLITDQAAAPIRSTKDVDIIAEIVTYVEYIAFSERLRKERFTEDAEAEPIACRWHHGDLVVDVLPLDKDVLGYANRWYEGALKYAVSVQLKNGISIRVISAPFFLGTKMEAFRGRGSNDYMASRDLEDLFPSSMVETPFSTRFNARPTTSRSI